MPTQIDRQFASMGEFVEYVSGPSDVEDRITTCTDRAEWQGTADWDEAAAKVFRWDEGAERVQAMRAKISAGVERFKVETYRSAQLPGVVVMDDYIKGKPRPVIALRKSQDKLPNAGKVVRLAINAFASGSVSTEVLITRGAAVMALADAIEKRGGKVEVVIRYTAGNRSGSTKVNYEVTVKRAGQNLNLNSVAFAMAHPSMCRRMCFGAMERENATVRKAIGATGASVGFYAYPASNPMPGEVYLPCASGYEPQWSSEDGAIAWVNDYLAREGWV
jgi:hypothetical protein